MYSVDVVFTVVGSAITPLSAMFAFYCTRECRQMIRAGRDRAVESRYEYAMTVVGTMISSGALIMGTLGCFTLALSGVASLLGYTCGLLVKCTMAAYISSALLVTFLFAAASVNHAVAMIVTIRNRSDYGRSRPSAATVSLLLFAAAVVFAAGTVACGYCVNILINDMVQVFDSPPIVAPMIKSGTNKPTRSISPVVFLGESSLGRSFRSSGMPGAWEFSRAFDVQRYHLAKASGKKAVAPTRELAMADGNGLPWHLDALTTYEIIDTRRTSLSQHQTSPIQLSLRVAMLEWREYAANVETHPTGHFDGTGWMAVPDRLLATGRTLWTVFPSSDSLCTSSL